MIAVSDRARIKANHFLQSTSVLCDVIDVIPFLGNRWCMRKQSIPGIFTGSAAWHAQAVDTRHLHRRCGLGSRLATSKVPVEQNRNFQGWGESTLSYNFLFFSYRCGTGVQGISVNCGDFYGSHLDCQWIDVTDVPLGRYILRQSVNPDQLAQESDYKNNIVECTVDIGTGYYRTRIEVVKDSCRLSGNS